MAKGKTRLISLSHQVYFQTLDKWTLWCRNSKHRLLLWSHRWWLWLGWISSFRVLLLVSSSPPPSRLSFCGLTNSYLLIYLLWTVKLPFPLTLGFKPMMQRGISTPDMDTRWVSSLSWYFLNFFGLNGVYRLLLGNDGKSVNWVENSQPLDIQRHF